MGDIVIGKGDVPVPRLGEHGNRHGMVVDATGTGKSTSLVVMAEGFSRLAVPVLMAGVKGDISRMAMAGVMNGKLAARARQAGAENYESEANPVVFRNLHGKLGHRIRTTVSEMGPILFARSRKLNVVQAGALGGTLGGKR